MIFPLTPLPQCISKSLQQRQLSVIWWIAGIDCWKVLHVKKWRWKDFPSVLVSGRQLGERFLMECPVKSFLAHTPLSKSPTSFLQPLTLFGHILKPQPAFFHILILSTKTGLFIIDLMFFCLYTCCTCFHFLEKSEFLFGNRHLFASDILAKCHYCHRHTWK